MTDVTLMRKAIHKMLNNYRVIILDQAYEHSINTDILFGIVKRTKKNARRWGSSQAENYRHVYLATSIAETSITT